MTPKETDQTLLLSLIAGDVLPAGFLAGPLTLSEANAVLEPRGLCLSVRGETARIEWAIKSRPEPRRTTHA